MPIVVGGSAFGHDDQRARALGATAWARDAQGAVTAMSGLPSVVPPASPLPAALAGEQAELELVHRQLVATLRAGWSLTGEAPAAGEEPTPAALADAGDVLEQLLHAVSAALLTGDARPVAETFAWTADLMQNRGVDIAQVRELGELLGATLRDYPCTGTRRAILRRRPCLRGGAFRAGNLASFRMLMRRQIRYSFAAHHNEVFV